MVACKFYFIFYFYLPLKSCVFNYNNLLLLINISVDIIHCNHQPSSHINNIPWKLTNYIKAKCLCEVIFFLYRIDYLDHSVHPPTPPFLLGDWAFYQMYKKVGLDRMPDFSEGPWEREMWPFSKAGGGLKLFYEK